MPWGSCKSQEIREGRGCFLSRQIYKAAPRERSSLGAAGKPYGRSHPTRQTAGPPGTGPLPWTDNPLKSALQLLSLCCCAVKSCSRRGKDSKDLHAVRRASL